MADGLEIAFSVSGLSSAISGIGQMAQNIERLNLQRVRAAGGQGDFDTAFEFLKVAQSAARAAEGVRVFAFFLTELVTVIGAAAAAAQNLTNVQKQQAALNASTSETLALRALGMATGGDFGSAAAALRQQANFDPLGRMAAGRLGLPFNPRDLSSAQDLGKFLLDAIKGAHQQFLTDPEAERLTLRNLPALQGFANIIETQANLLPILEQQAQVQKSVYNPGAIAAATEFKVQVAALGSSFLALGTALGSLVLPAVNMLTATLNDFVRLGAQTAGFISRIMFFFDSKGGNSTQDAHTKAMQNHTDALNNMAGTFGGGPRAHGAIPGAFSGMVGTEWQFLKGDAARLGAYSLGL